MTSLKISLRRILDDLDIKYFKGNPEVLIEDIVNLQECASSSEFSWCGLAWQENLAEKKCGTFLVDIKTKPEFLNDKCNYLMVENPRFVFMQLLKKYFPTDRECEIAESAKIHSSAILGEELDIGNNVVIEKDCQIGSNVAIGHNTVIGKGTTIESNVVIGANCVIGGVGFGFEKNPDGFFERIPHIGNVHIAERVEIGANVTIDRAVLGATKIGFNVKIDNHVHVSHGVVINSNTLIMANAMLAGSSCIGKDVWLGPSVSVINKVKVNDGSLVGIGSTVTRELPGGMVISGNPAKALWQRR